MYILFVQICFHGTLLAAYSLTRKALSALYMCGGVLANWTFPFHAETGVFIKFSPKKKESVTETFQIPLCQLQRKIVIFSKLILYICEKSDALQSKNIE